MTVSPDPANYPQQHLPGDTLQCPPEPTASEVALELFGAKIDVHNPPKTLLWILAVLFILAVIFLGYSVKAGKSGDNPVPALIAGVAFLAIFSVSLGYYLSDKHAVEEVNKRLKDRADKAGALVEVARLRAQIQVVRSMQFQTITSQTPNAPIMPSPSAQAQMFSGGQLLLWVAWSSLISFIVAAQLMAYLFRHRR